MRYKGRKARRRARLSNKWMDRINLAGFVSIGLGIIGFSLLFDPSEGIRAPPPGPSFVVELRDAYDWAELIVEYWTFGSLWLVAIGILVVFIGFRDKGQ